MCTPGDLTAADHPGCLVRFGPERRVRRRHDELELPQFVLLHVHRSVRADVGLDPLDQPESSAVFPVQDSISRCCWRKSVIETPPAIFNPYE